MTAATAERPRTAIPSNSILWDPKPARFFSFDRYTGKSQLGNYEITVQDLDGSTQISVGSFRWEAPLNLETVESDASAINQAIHRARAHCQAHLTWHLNHDTSWEEIPDALVF